MEIKINQHHRKTIRLKGYNYTAAGYYFVTICTNNQEDWFGNIVGGKTRLSHIGKIVQLYWQKIPDLNAHVDLDSFVIMPNHIHGIVIIKDLVDSRKGVRKGVQLNALTTAITNATESPTTSRQDNYYSQISPQKGSLSVIIRTSKAAVTKWCRENGYEYFRWQRNFYGRIIRNKQELYRIRQYILNNPRKWEIDREIPGNRAGEIIGAHNI